MPAARAYDMAPEEYDLALEFRENDTDRDWIIEQIANLTESHEVINVVEWAEEKRYLPPELTSKPGYYDPSVAPFMIEIMEALSANSPVTHVDLMKSAQITATTVGENVIGYQIDHAPGPAMYLTADDGLAKRWMETRLDAMLQHSGLDEKIQSTSGQSRKSGDTALKKEYPGGFLLSQGARSAAKMRMTSIKYLTMDEIDGWPLSLGKEGDTAAIAENRTRAYEDTRKVFAPSTPTLLSTSRIYKRYKLGDQRKYFVPCPHCGELQELRWHWTNDEGEKFGVVYELDDHGNLKEESVGYRSECCDGLWRNHHKAKFLQLSSGAHWGPTATSSAPTRRSYHISALYSPVGIYSWSAMVRDFLKAWDPTTDRVRDIPALQVFYNQSLGQPWEDRGESPKAEKVKENRRAVYNAGQVPNVVAVKEAESHVVLLTAAADVHKDRIDVEVIGWTTKGRSYSIEWLSLKGDTLDTESEAWSALREMIESKTWSADDGKQYRLTVTFIDAGYRTDTVMGFCSEYSSGVVAIQGRDTPKKGARLREFWEFIGQNGENGLHVNSTTYKDRLAAWLRKEWDGHGDQPAGYCNYPTDYPDSYFHQYEAETKVEQVDKRTGFTRRYWKKTRNDNHAWDCRVYNMAALDYVIYTYCVHNWGLDEINYNYFWEWALEEAPFYSE
jgi:phage terminase large subunit GpA-like protein